VRPHPHVHLATVTYLFEGAIRHRDSLGSDQRIEPGAINGTTAGRGIVHSELKAPEEGGRLHGTQLWVALPAKHENVEPSFSHHPSASLPPFTLGQAELRVLMGTVLGRTSPVALHSDLFYVDVKLPKGETLRFDPESTSWRAASLG
jgi:redox-sensitive bicupin YhaK (pirin superfamily)